MNNINLYKVLSLAKLFLGLVILFFVHFFLNPYQDPVVALTVDALGIFLLFWGASFFLFNFFYNFKKDLIHETKYKLSYKASILFGLRSLLNLLLIFGGIWNKFIGLATLIIFVSLRNFIVK